MTTIKTLIQSTAEPPHDDEGLKLYLARISLGHVSVNELCNELHVKAPQLHRWLKSKPHLIQTGARSILFQKNRA